MRILFQKITVRVVCFAILCVLLGCGFTAKQTKLKYPGQVSSEMKVEFDRLEQQFTSEKYATAKAGYESYITRYPYNALTDIAEFRLGQILLLNSKYAEATQRFEALIQKTPDPSVASRARVKAGISEYRMGHTQQALAYFNRTEGQYIRYHDKIKVGGLSLQVLDKTGANLEQKSYYYALLLDAYGELSDTAIASKYGGEAPARSLVLTQLEAWAKQAASPDKIDSRFKTYQSEQSAPYINYKLGMSYYSAGQTKLAKQYLAKLVEAHPTLQLSQQARPTLAKLGYKPGKSKFTQKQYKVGVILPLSGKYESYGSNMLNGMECAASSRPGCSGVQNIRLLIRDDQGVANLAVQAVEELVKKENVQIIVGPLSSTSAEAAAKKAQELGVVMISLAQKQGIPQVGDKIFRFSLTPEQQVQSLLEYATSKQNKKLFAVLYPKSNYGRVFNDAFKNLVSRYGATVTTTGGYSRDADLAEAIRQMKFGVAKVSLEAPIGFEAIFIPDSYVLISKLVPHLQAAGLDKMFLLGTNAWNDPSLLQKVANGLDGSVFLDIYFQHSKNELVQAFNEQYLSAFGNMPSTLEAMGYDVIRFLGQGFAGNKVATAEDIKSVLMNYRNYRGVTGLRSFQANQESKLDPYLLTIRNGEIQEIAH